MRFFAAITGFLMGATIFWMMWPAPFEPAEWNEPHPPALAGAFALNEDLDLAETLRIGPRGTGEGLAVGADDRIYFGTQDGRLGRVTPAHTPDGWVIEDLAEIADVPIMGLAWIDTTTLGIAANSGLLALNTETLELQSLSTGSPARRFGFVNDLDVAADGTVYFTDSSTRWGHQSDSPGYFYDMLENRAYGILYAWSPQTRTTRIVRDGLYYPNGVLVEPGGQSVLVTESFRYSIQRIWISGSRAGQIETFADNLPGMPDGLDFGPDGQIYVAMLNQRSSLLRFIRSDRFWTKMLVKLPPWLRPGGGNPTGFILVLDPSTGQAVDSFHDPNGRLNYISTVVPSPDGSVWFGSSYGGYLGRFETPLREEPDVSEPSSLGIETVADSGPG